MAADARLSLARAIVELDGDRDEARGLAEAAFAFADSRSDHSSRTLAAEAQAFLAAL